MPSPSTPLLLRHLFSAFAVTLALLTAVLVANFAAESLQRLSVRGAPAAEVMLLALPAIMALTVPMAVFVAVLCVFTRLGADGVLAAAQRERRGIRRLVAPVLGAAAVVTALTFALNTQILPRANGRFEALAAGMAVQKTDRSMTIGELREAARAARADGRPNGTARAVGLEVEIQKKFALAASCLVMALTAAMIAIRFPGRRKRLILAASTTVFSVYYIALLMGEVLADDQVISPFVAMWMANAFLLVVTLFLAWRPDGSDAAPPLPTEPFAISG